MITLRLQQMRVPPGQRILLEAISWHEFEAIVEELREHRERFDNGYASHIQP